MGERKRKKKDVGGKNEKTKNSCVCNPEARTLALHAFPAFQYIYQRIELTQHIGPQSVYVFRALCIIVLRS